LLHAANRVANGCKGVRSGGIGKEQSECEVGLETINHESQGSICVGSAILHRTTTRSKPRSPPHEPEFTGASPRTYDAEAAWRCGMSEHDRDRTSRRASMRATILIGIGVMAAVDEIVFHQLLGWHHFYDAS